MKKKTKLLLTGGCGFIGHHFVEGILKETDWEIIVLDRLDISGSLERLRDTNIWESQKHRVKFIWWDLKSPLNDFAKNDIGEVDYIWHLAASSHVDRSIQDPLSFVMDNTVGTCNILNFARELKNLRLFIYFSTDEVFGPAPEGVYFREWDRYKCGNPYAATKAGAEELCLAFENTYKLPVVITHCMNVFGERQHPEKFIPMTIRKIYKGEKILIHSDPTRTKSGSRCWIHARNVLRAVYFITDKFEKGEARTGDKFNIVGEERTNLAIAEFIAKTMGRKLDYELVDFHSSRPGHDLRYALDGSKLKSMGFEYPKNLEQTLEKTIKWSLKHKRWLNL